MSWGLRGPWWGLRMLSGRPGWGAGRQPPRPQLAVQVGVGRVGRSEPCAGRALRGVSSVPGLCAGAAGPHLRWCHLTSDTAIRLHCAEL